MSNCYSRKEGCEFVGGKCVHCGQLFPPRSKDPKPKYVVKVTENCEWCECMATHRISAIKGYRRFACDAHYEKTRRLVMLDGRDDDPVVLMICSGGFQRTEYR